MSLKSAPYYWVECDGCGLSAEEGTDHAAWQQEWVAYQNAEDADFRAVPQFGGQEGLTLPDLHYCLDCAEKRGLNEEES